MARNKFDVDEALEGRFSFSQIKRLSKYVLPYRKIMLITLSLMLLTSMLNMLSPYITRAAIDECIPNKELLRLVVLGGLLLAIYVLNAIIVKFRIRAMSIAGNGIIASLREDLFAHLQLLPFSYYDSRPHGKILVRVINYVNALSNLLSTGLINLITDSFTVLVILVFMFTLSIELTLLCLCGVAVFGVILFFFKDKQRRVWQLYSAKQSNLNAYIHESICGIKVTQSFAREKENQKIFAAQCENVRKSFMAAKIIDICNWPMVETISTISTAAVFLAGAALMAQKSMSVGTIVAFAGYVSMFWTPVLNLCNFYNSLMTAAAYVERIFETLDTPITVFDREDAVIMPPLNGSVDFKNVTFAYEEGENVLENVSFHVDCGKTVALVGPTGAGKTTIINLLSRFYNILEGQILIDDIDISAVTLHSLRSQMGVMLQDTFIFSGTVMENIRYGRPDASDDECIAAAKAVCAHDFISTLPDSYMTEVNERGTRLSVGQRQLISFARALLANPKILILDEATASIDTCTERALQEGLARLLVGRTSFIIAHRLSTIKNADRIMYVSDRKILEDGSHEELMSPKGHYFKLYTAQYELSQ
ncbi:MAG: ABC transporter ATP-binding protein [Clostridia bacterium]|nr:ABC transporter ATP-binding protein [Clostridia bacterium]